MRHLYVQFMLALFAIFIVSGCASLRINSSPPGAAIFINDIATGRSTPATFTLHEMARGTYNVSIRKDGYETLQDQLIVKTRLRSIIGSILPPILIAECFNDYWKGLYLSKKGAECITGVWLWGDRQPMIEAYFKTQAEAATTDLVDIEKVHPVITYALKPIFHDVPYEPKRTSNSAPREEVLKSSTSQNLYSSGLALRIKTLKDLRDSSAITEEEYLARRKVLVDKASVENENPTQFKSPANQSDNSEKSPAPGYGESVARLRPGMVVNVKVLVAGKKGVWAPGKRISDNGSIDLPLLSEIAVNNLTLDELRSRLAISYKDYFENPRVVVEFSSDDDKEGQRTNAE